MLSNLEIIEWKDSKVKTGKGEFVSQSNCLNRLIWRLPNKQVLVLPVHHMPNWLCLNWWNFRNYISPSEVICNEKETSQGPYTEIEQKKNIEHGIFQFHSTDLLMLPSLHQQNVLQWRVMERGKEISLFPPIVQYARSHSDHAVSEWGMLLYK